MFQINAIYDHFNVNLELTLVYAREAFLQILSGESSLTNHKWILSVFDVQSKFGRFSLLYLKNIRLLAADQ